MLVREALTAFEPEEILSYDSAEDAIEELRRETVALLVVGTVADDGRNSSLVLERIRHERLLPPQAVVLAITGGEALYADMGHFGRRPIQWAWCGLVLPALALNYMGQGALLMGDPQAIENPFYRLFPDSWLIPAVALATLAAIIASQAVISGAYSMTKQAMQLGFLPRMTIQYTSAREAGQIYIPSVNWLLLLAVISAVLHFGSSSALASAYGIAVTLTMAITTILTFFVVRSAWKLPLPLALLATVFFLAVDLLFVAGCAVKLFDGGWFPLVLGALLFTGMSTWARGRQLLLEGIHRDGLELLPFIEGLDPRSLHRSTRTAVYPASDPSTVPQALLHNLKHNQVLHERVVLVTVQTADTPHINDFDRIYLHRMGKGFMRLIVRYGFMESPDIPAVLDQCKHLGERFDMMETTFYLSRETIVPSMTRRMTQLRARLFSLLTKNATSASDFFQIPTNRVVELGTQLVI